MSREILQMYSFHQNYYAFIICSIWIGRVANSFVICGGDFSGRSTTMKCQRQTLRVASSTTTETEAIPVIQGIRDVVDDYDIFLLDMWYVVFY